MKYKFLKIAFIIFLFFITVNNSYALKRDVYVIDAVKNANMHNNLGVEYLDEKLYYAAIQEFKIAISLNPNSQASSTYYFNLGRAYMLISYPSLAQPCFENAIKTNPMNFLYYQKLVESFNKQGKAVLQKKLTYYSNKKDIHSKVVKGLIYINLGDKAQGIIVLDELCASEPDLILAEGIRLYLNTLNN